MSTLHEDPVTEAQRVGHVALAPTDAVAAQSMAEPRQHAPHRSPVYIGQSCSDGSGGVQSESRSRWKNPGILGAGGS